MEPGTYVTYEALETRLKQALDAAKEALKYAYCPYSGFSVGAALFTADGTIISGANYENVAYGPSICAERVAVVSANAMGVRSFKGIAVIARGKDFDTTEVTAPCGTCRQVLWEAASLAHENLLVILSTTKADKILVTTIKELLPLAFGPADLAL